MKWEQGRQTDGPGWKLQQRVGIKIEGRGVGSYNQEILDPGEKSKKRDHKVREFQKKKIVICWQF